MNRTILKSGFLTLAVLFISLLKGLSIGEETQIGAKEVSLGNAGVVLITPFSVFNNQAALAYITNFTLAVDYRQPFMINGFAQKCLVIISPLPVATFAFSLQQKGIDGYTETHFGLAFAKSLGKKFSAGIRFNYFLTGFPEQTKSLGTFFVDFGVIYKTANNLTFGLHIFNPSRASIESLNLKSKLPSGATSGIAVKGSENLLFVSAVAYCIDKPLNITTGIEYKFTDAFSLRFGLSGKPIQHSAGFGYKYKNVIVDVALAHHETLGYTPSISLGLNL
ncbi:MAG: hypothetical protein WCL21_10120 [Mariniphaga sp.]